MKKLFLSGLVLFTFTLFVKAQAAIPISCGTIIENEFSNDFESQSYVIEIDAGTQLRVSASPLGQTLQLGFGIYAPNNEIVGIGGELHSDMVEVSSAPFEETSILSARGSYSIITYNYSFPANERTNLSEAIESEENTIEVGDIVPGNSDEYVEYTLHLSEGENITIDLTSIDFDTFLELKDGPASIARDDDSGEGANSHLEFTAPRTTDYTIVVRAFSGAPNGSYVLTVSGDIDTSSNSGGRDESGGIGVYTLYIGCTLRDGTVIEPGDILTPPLVNPVESFTGFGFPGVSPVDFSQGVEIPLEAGQPQIAPIASDLVALYTYAAGAEEVATLSISRVSGNISIGVAVINRDTNEIIFLGGMPSSNNLSVELTFPTAGTYTIGLFQLNTSTRSDTSGAVQITIE